MLLDLVLTLAVAALLALIVLPMLPRGTSAARHAGYAMQVAALLKADRSAARRAGHPVGTIIETGVRRVVSGSTGRSVVLARDLSLDVLGSDHCLRAPGTFAITFSPDGRTCGVVVRIVKQERAWTVRVNWLTGYVDVERSDAIGSPG
jgi:general secretion pathway protein H